MTSSPVPRIQLTIRAQAVSVELEHFIRKETGLSPKRKLKASDTRENDLGATGDAADEFMGAFAKRFNDEAGDFDFHRYFATEGRDI